MHVRHERPEDRQGGHTRHARALEIDRIEIHPDIRPVDRLQDFPADFRDERGAIVIFENEEHGRMTIGQPPKVLRDDAQADGRILVPTEASEEETQGVRAEPLRDDDLPIDVSMTVTSYRAAKAETP